MIKILHALLTYCKNDLLIFVFFLLHGERTVAAWDIQTDLLLPYSNAITLTLAELREGFTCYETIMIFVT